jgi:hypothetical protein
MLMSQTPSRRKIACNAITSSTVVGQLTKNRTETVIAAIERCNGFALFTLQGEKVAQGGNLVRPRRKRVAVRVSLLPALGALVDLAIAEARRQGLLVDRCGNVGDRDV